MSSNTHRCYFGLFSRRLLSFLFVFGLLLVVAAEVRAQESEAAKEEAMLREGAWALQFQITQNFTLDSFQGGTLSFKRHFSEQSALRVGLTLNAGLQQSENESRDQVDAGNQDEQSEIRNSDDGNSQSMALEAQYIQYVFAERPITLFYGAGPAVSFDRSEDNRQSETVDDGEVIISQEEEGTSTSVGAGVAGVLGGEWFVRPDLSLSAEYRAVLRYQHSWSEGRTTRVNRQGGQPVVDVREHEGSTDSFDLRPGNVRFGLSLYF